MSDVKISIIMPSLNVKPFIKECVESVINQTLKDIEIICVDAGSTDGTVKILEKYEKKDSRMKILHSDKKSYGYQMNLGIKNANGEYIGIVETDDFIDSNMFEVLYDLTNNGNVDIAKVNFYHYYDENSNKVNTAKKNLPKIPFTVYDYPNILKGHPSIWAAIYKKNFLEKNNITFMEAPGGGWVDNPFLFETFLSAKSIMYKDEPFYFYRELNPSSSSNDLKDLTLPMRRMMDNLDVLDEYSCHDEDILTELYIRIFWHIHDLLKKDNFKQQECDILKGFYDILNRMDENIIKKRFNINDQKTYYKYGSPINIIDCIDNIELSQIDYKNLIKEHDFLYSQIDALEAKNRKLTKKNKKLKKKFKEVSEDKSSSSFSKSIKKLFKK